MEIPVASSGGHDDDDALLDAEVPSDDHRVLHGRRRRKIGKPLQLALLRRYVQCAKRLGCLPSRAATQQLLDDGYDEFVLHGGDASEPRIGYAAFLKLVRNRRGEVHRQLRGSLAHSLGRGGRRSQSERLQIRALIEELDQVRRSHTGGRVLDCEQLEASGDKTARGAEGESVAPAAPLSDVETSAPAPASPAAPLGTRAAADSESTRLGGESVAISREQLDAMLRFAQETLSQHKQLLEEVRAIEQRLELSHGSGHPHHEHDDDDDDHHHHHEDFHL